MENKNLVLIAQFCRHHQLESSLMASFFEFGLIKIITIGEEQYLYKDELNKIEKMVRLHVELGINFEGIDAIHTLLDQIDILQQELIITKKRLEAFAPDPLDDDDNQQNN